jgi:hypothetical protein
VVGSAFLAGSVPTNSNRDGVVWQTAEQAQALSADPLSQEFFGQLFDGPPGGHDVGRVGLERVVIGWPRQEVDDGGR